MDDARGGAASGHCPVPGSGAVQGPLPGPGLAPDHHVVAEFDGRTKYHTEEDTFLEKLRQDELESLGWRFFRATWSSLSDMRTQADRLLSMFPLEVVSRLSPVAGLQGGGLWGERPPGVLVP